MRIVGFPAIDGIDGLGSRDIGERNISVSDCRVPQIRDPTSQFGKEGGIDSGKSIFVSGPYPIGNRSDWLSGHQSRSSDKLSRRKIRIADRINEIRRASGGKDLRRIAGEKPHAFFDDRPAHGSTRIDVREVVFLERYGI